MRARAGHVGVLAGRQVESLDDAELGQQVQRPKERRPADAEPPLAGRGLELGGGEVPVVLGDEVGDGASRLGQPVAGVIEGVDDGIRFDHRPTIPRIHDACRD